MGSERIKINDPCTPEDNDFKYQSCNFNEKAEALFFFTSDYCAKFIDLDKVSDDAYLSQMISSIGQRIVNIQKPFIDYQNPQLIYNQTMLDITLKYTKLEKLAIQRNQFLLSRGTRGVSDEYYLNNPITINNFFGIDAALSKKDGKPKSLSYGLSLFAGTVFERIIYGARSIDFMLNSLCGYVIVIKIADYFNPKYSLQDLLHIPYLTTTASLFGRGEYFHARTKRYTDNPNQTYSCYGCSPFHSKLTSHEYAKKMSYLLEHIHIVYVNNKKIEQLSKQSQEKILLFLNTEIQRRYKISAQEDEEFKRIKKQFFDGIAKIKKGFTT